MKKDSTYRSIEQRWLAEQSDDKDNDLAKYGSEVMSRVKKLAVEKPLIVVGAGLALGLLSGFVLKRR